MSWIFRGDSGVQRKGEVRNTIPSQVRTRAMAVLLLTMVASLPVVDAHEAGALLNLRAAVEAYQGRTRYSSLLACFS
eukprot:1439277-Alexandrium_andersonii.AAC.1